MAKVSTGFLVHLTLLAAATVADESPACSSHAECALAERGHAMLQTKSQRRGASPPPSGKCPLPAGAKWCEVHLKNLPSYWMAVYDSSVNNDVVSGSLCTRGYWEEDDMSKFGPPGHLLDIGGNIGYFTIAFAQAGWKVTTFEPMAPNLALIGASLCQNPQLASNIRLNKFGLGTKNQQCKMLRPSGNAGDGFTRCEDEANITTKVAHEDGFVEVGRFNMRRLDEVLAQQAIATIDVVKIDVEGYEFQVFAGAPGFLAKYRPRLIKSEVWRRLVGFPQVSGIDYLDMFEKAGYKFYSDTNCQLPMDPKKEILTRAIDVVMCMHK